MTKEQYRRKFDIFRSTCLLYATEKSQLEQLEKRYPSLKEINIEEGKFRIDLSREYEAGELERYQLLKENVEMTETYFKDIEEMFGEKAKDILWELFIQDRSQTDVGEDYEMSRRQVQYAMDKWLQKLFEKELQKTEQSDRQ
ncbi:MAG: hypothetical protein IKF60_04880 [Solobacterium sp.]|nr:hypothetical protein [Solobacterium sp.]